MRNSRRRYGLSSPSFGAMLPALLLAAACGSSSGGPAVDVDGGDSGKVASGGFDAGHSSATDHVPDAHSSTTSATSKGSSATTSQSSLYSSSTTQSGHDAGDATTSRGDGGSDANRPDTSTGSDSGRDSGADVFVASDASDATTLPDTGIDVFVPGVDASVCPNGMGTIAVVGGTSSVAFGATSRNGEHWELTGFPANSVDSTPAIVSYGTGFLALFSNAGSTDIKSSLWSAGPASWSTPVPVPSAGGNPSTELGSPSLAVIGATAQLVYQGSNDFFYHGVYSGGVWGAAGDPVGGMVSQDFGPSPPSAVAAGGILYAGYDGSNNGLYVDTWTSGSGWAGANPITGAGVGEVPPTMVALTGGPADVMIVFIQQSTNFLYSVVHTTAGGWASPIQVSSTATATSPVSLAPLPNGGVVMVYEGMNQLPYGTTYNPSGSAWSTPVSMYPSSLPLQNPPAVATGVCGVDAIAALAEVEGVEIVTLSGNTWSPPVLINGTSQITWAAIATSSSSATPIPDASAPNDAKSDQHAGDATMGNHDAALDSSHLDSPTSSPSFECPTRKGTLALLGGSSDGAFAATSKNGGDWALDSFTGQTVGAIPAIVPYSGGFLGLFSTSLSGDIYSTLYKSGWSTPTAITINGGGDALEIGGPALSVLGSDVEYAYLGTDYNLYQGVYHDGAWGPASTPITDPPQAHDSSPSQPSAATVGDTLYVAYDGSNNGLYVDSFTVAGGWADEQAIFGAGVGTIPPTLIPLTSSGAGSPDMMLAFEFLNTNFIYATVHTSGDGGTRPGTWGPVQQISGTVNTYNIVSLAALPDGGAVLLYEGENGLPYSVQYSASGSTWSAPVAVSPSGGTLLSAPSVATGVCGYDAVAALVVQDGVQVTTLTSGAWSPPVLVDGLSGMTYATVATQP